MVRLREGYKERIDALCALFLWASFVIGTTLATLAGTWAAYRRDPLFILFAVWNAGFAVAGMNNLAAHWRNYRAMTQGAGGDG